MSKENAKAFVQAVLNDEELRERAKDLKPEDAVPLGKEMGYDFTLEEFTDVMNEDRELSPDELENVAGGYFQTQVNMHDASRNYAKIIDKAKREAHCFMDLSQPLHTPVFVRHEEKPILGGIFGWSQGYDIVKCTRCGQEGRKAT